MDLFYGIICIIFLVYLFKKDRKQGRINRKYNKNDYEVINKQKPPKPAKTIKKVKPTKRSKVRPIAKDKKSAYIQSCWDEVEKEYRSKR